MHAPEFVPFSRSILRLILCIELGLINSPRLFLGSRCHSALDESGANVGCCAGEKLVIIGPVNHFSDNAVRPEKRLAKTSTGIHDPQRWYPGIFETTDTPAFAPHPSPRAHRSGPGFRGPNRASLSNGRSSHRRSRRSGANTLRHVPYINEICPRRIGSRSGPSGSANPSSQCRAEPGGGHNASATRQGIAR